MTAPKLDHVRRVHIGGEVLQVRSDADPQTIEQVAEVVDTHVRRLQAAGLETDRFRLGVLAALHVAGELFEARSERDEARAATDAALARLAEAMLERDASALERDRVRDEHGSVQAELEERRGRIESLESDLEALRAQRDGLVAERERLLADLLVQRGENESLRTDTSARDALEARNEGLRSELEEWKALAETAEADRQGSLAELESALRARDEAESRAESAKDELDTLRARLGGILSKLED